MSGTGRDSSNSMNAHNDDDAPDPAGTGQSRSAHSSPEGFSDWWDRVDGPPGIGPTDDEVAAWAEQEHLRRQAWLSGPTDEEKHEWRRRERQRRLARLGYANEAEPIGDLLRLAQDDRRRLSRRYAREAQLATEGLGLLLATLPFRMIAELVSAGREFEEDYSQPQRRRVPLYDDDVL